VTADRQKAVISAITAYFAVTGRGVKVTTERFRTHSVYDIALMGSPSASCWRGAADVDSGERGKGGFSAIILNRVL
jgi:hypothetical protein